MLPLQWSYFALSLAWLIANLSCALRNARPLTPTNVRAALIVYATYAATLLFAAPYVTLYRALMVGFVIVLGYGGVIVHLRGARDLSHYRGRGAWLGAIAINLFGVIVNLAAALFGPTAPPSLR